MKRYKTTITLTENQLEALISVFDWLVPHRDEYVETEYKASIKQIENKLDKAENDISLQKQLHKQKNVTKIENYDFLKMMEWQKNNKIK